MKKLMSIVLVFSLLAGLFSVCGVTVSAVGDYGLVVGQTAVSASKHSGTGWSYDAETSTLTLSGYQGSKASAYSVKSQMGTEYWLANIYSENDLNV